MKKPKYVAFGAIQAFSVVRYQDEPPIANKLISVQLPESEWTNNIGVLEYLYQIRDGKEKHIEWLLRLQAEITKQLPVHYK